MTLMPIAKASERETERAELERLAASFEPKIAKAVREALEAQAETIDYAALRQALTARDAQRVLELVGAIAPNAGAVQAALEDAVWAGGALVQERPALKRLEIGFQRLDPVLTQWLTRYSGNLVREIDNGSRDAIRDIVDRGLAAGASPIDTARKIRESVGLTTRQARAVESYRRALETIHLKRSAAAWGLGKDIDRVNGRQVLKPGPDGKPGDGILRFRLRDFRYDGVLQRALGSGKPLSPEQIERQVAAYRRKYLRHRSENIARTETLRALVGGGHEAWRQAVAAGKVRAAALRRIWIVAKDERLCPRCAGIPKLNPDGVGMAEPFETPLDGLVSGPPIHTNCRCTVFIEVRERLIRL